MRVNHLILAAGPRFIVLAVWILLIIWLSLTNSPPTPDSWLFSSDKALHSAAYCALTLLAGWAFSGIAPLSRRSWLLIALSAVLIGGGLEAAQALFTVTRQADPRDLVANAVGASIAFLASRVLDPPGGSARGRGGKKGNG